MSATFRRGQAVDWTARLQQYAPPLSRAAAYIVSILAAAPFVYHLAHGSTAYLGLLEDDYYYYAIIADKFVTLGKLTFDGTTLTNGFHPLWFAIVVLLRSLFGRFGTAYYGALTLVFLVSMILTYELSRRFARKLGASPHLSAAVAAVYAVGTGRLLTNGMESIVAVPLFLWLLIEIADDRPVTPRRATKLGLIASLAILGRLDIALALVLLIPAYVLLVRPPLGVLCRVLAAFSLAGILLPLYAAANFVFFGSPLPMSALAKQLQTSPGFSIWYARATAQWTVYGPTVGLVLPAGLIALFLLVRSDPGKRPAGRVAGGLAIVFSFVFFGLNALTGWIFFGWYAYPLAPALVAAVVFIVERWAPVVPGTRARVLGAAILVALAPALAVREYLEHGPGWSRADNSMLAMSYDLADHLRGREGLFSMGAIAGVATYVLDKPVFQLEGIVGDRALVEHLRRQDPLEDVLREYHVDYLIVSLAKVRSEKHEGCYLVTQPNPEWAGDRTAKMRGEICAEPVEHFFTPHGTNPWSIFPTIETLVWDVRNAPWKRTAGATAGSSLSARKEPSQDR